MLGRNFLALPMHAGRGRIVDLHPVHADVPLSGSRIARDNAAIDFRANIRERRQATT